MGFTHEFVLGKKVGSYLYYTVDDMKERKTNGTIHQSSRMKEESGVIVIDRLEVEGK